MECADIFKLRDMLAAAHIPHKFIDHCHDGRQLYQIYYPDADSWRCSVLQGTEITDAGVEIADIGVEILWRSPVRDHIEYCSAEDAFRKIYLSYVKWRWHEGKA